MHVSVITDDNQFASLRRQWNDLAGEAPFRRWEWMASWREAYRDLGELHILRVADAEDRILGFAPWYASDSWRHGRRLEFLGSGKACGDDVSLIAAPGAEESVADAVAGWLLDRKNADAWDWIRLEGVSVDDPGIGRLTKALEAGGSAVLRRDDLARYAVELPATWDEYLDGFGKNARKLARKSRRRLETPDEGYAIRTPQSEAECLELFETIVELHQRRWRGHAEGGCFATDQFDNFLRDAVRRWYAEGTLRLTMVTAHGAPVAGGIAVAFGSTLSVYLVGRDPECGNRDVGWILWYELIHQAFAEGLKTIDFLRGDEPFKLALGAKPRPQIVVEIAGRGAFNRVRYLATTGRDLAKRLVRGKPTMVGA